jgi:hypothetical protein
MSSKNASTERPASARGLLRRLTIITSSAAVTGPRLSVHHE